MSKKGLSGSRRRTRHRKPKIKNKRQNQTSLHSWSVDQDLRGWPSKAPHKGLKVHHFAGVALAGGKTDKTCLAMVEYYPAQNKIFLSRLFEKIKTEGEISADLQLHRLLTQSPGKLEMVAFDVPLQLPKCLLCPLPCPGYEECNEPEIQWMWKQYRRLNQKRKPKKLFTPYTERCVETYLATELEETFHLPHALGANVAPLTARAQYVTRRLQIPKLEVFPKLSVWRVGRALNVARSHLMFHKHAVGGDESRQVFLHRLVEKDLAFLYEQDRRVLIENNQAFEAFISALTAVLSFRGDCEPRPKDFPKNESWIAIPSENLKF